VLNAEPTTMYYANLQFKRKYNGLQHKLYSNTLFKYNSTKERMNFELQLLISQHNSLKHDVHP